MMNYAYHDSGIRATSGVIHIVTMLL